MSWTGLGGDEYKSVKAALVDDAENPLSAAAVRIDSDVRAARAGDLMLTVTAAGAVFLADGIPPRELSPMHEGALMQAFTARRPFGSLMRGVRVQVATVNAALLGAEIPGLEQAVRE